MFKTTGLGSRYLKILGIDVIKEPTLQYEEVYEKAKQVLKNWYYRKLTLLGRILIVNTLIASLFVYSMQVLESPPDSFFDKCEKMILEFIWKGRKPKIKIELLQSSSEHGGLKLVNLRNKDTALKLAWLVRKDKYVLTQLKTLIPVELGQRFWECTLNEVDVQTLFRDVEHNQFWLELVKTWCKKLRGKTTMPELIQNAKYVNK